MDASRGKPAYFISDLHLGATYRGLRPDREEILIRFLEQKASNASHLFILGDLFEFWMEYRSFIPKEHFRTLAALGRLAASGVEVHYLSGNHDFSLELQGRKLLLLHGDGIASSDWKYRVMKSIMTHPLSNKCFSLIHPDFGMALARRLSKASRDQHNNEPRLMDEYEAASRALLKHGGQDILMHGHTHAAFVKKVPEGLYVNSGEWLQRMEYVAMEDGSCRIERFATT
jgi:UDP-2,3-diacylglucosamine hydrolase